jgi:hypothetical protein
MVGQIEKAIQDQHIMGDIKHYALNEGARHGSGGLTKVARFARNLSRCIYSEMEVPYAPLSGRTGSHS